MTPVPASVQRLRTAAVCSLLTAAVFLQEPGRVLTDTKLDLSVDPWSWLQRAMHLWEPHGWMGQVQNQAYGYLFPMGPFFGLWHSVGVPAWVVQRLWASMLLCVALVGVARLTRAMRIGSPTTALAAGVLYVLSPRFLTTLGPISAETLPMAVAPWLVLPLVLGSASGRLRPAAARSGLAVLGAGAVNAAATLAVLPLPLLYLLTRRAGPHRRRLTGWWVLAVAAACAWWIVPLVLLGRLSPPFLDWIESARITTIPTSLVETLRGTSDWVAFSAGTSGPFWRGGWLLVTQPPFILDTVLVACLGLAGLAHRALPERRWLALSVLVGIVGVTFGHMGPLAGPFAGPAQSLLDGALAAFRNVHKFDPLLRLPLALASAHALAGIVRVVRATRAPGLVPLSAGVAAVVLAGVASPLLTGQLAPSGSFEAIPGYWNEVGAYLRTHNDGAALIAPGASFGTYLWGNTRDEPLQALAASPWTVRDAVPLAPAGTVRMLDAIQRRFVDGQGGPGLSALLAQSGIRYVVVRNDLDYGRAGAARPSVVHEALAESPGLARVATFGPWLGGGSVPGSRVDANLDLARRAVEVYEVYGAAPRVQAVPLDSATRVVGGPETLGDLADAGVRVGTALFEGDLESVPTLQAWARDEEVLTDGYRRREVDFGHVDNHASAVLSTADPLRLNNPARDYLPYPDRLTTTAVDVGAGVSASSSLSDAGTVGGTQPSRQPFSGVDGDTTTSWSSSTTAGAIGQWLQLDLMRPTSVKGLRLTVLPDETGSWVDRIRITTDAGQLDSAVPTAGISVVVPTPPGLTHSVRVEALRVSNGGNGSAFVVAEMNVPGIDPQRPLRLPTVSGSPKVLVLTAETGRAGCVEVGSRPLCAEGLQRDAERTDIDRLVPPLTGTWEIAGTVSARPGPALDALLDAEVHGIRASASSSAVSDPRGRPQAAIDGDLGTGWVAASGDHTPTLTLTLPEPRLITGLVVRLDAALAASAPLSVRLRTPDGQLRQGKIGSDNRVVFGVPVRASRLVLTFPDVRPEGSTDPFTGRVDLLPVGVSEIAPLGAEDLIDAVPGSERVDTPCGSGPSVTVNDSVWKTSVSGTRASVEQLAPQTLTICGRSVTVLTGARIRVTVDPSAAWRPLSLTMQSQMAAVRDRPAAIGARLIHDSPDHRVIEIAARQTTTLVMVRENANPGWRAVAGGRDLVRVTVDGWYQGYILPAGPATSVDLVFTPQRVYSAGLLAGLVLVLLLIVSAVLPVRSPAPGRVLGATTSRWLDVVLLVGALTWVGGAGGAVAAMFGVVAANRLRRHPRLSWAAPICAAGLLLAAGLGYVVHPWAGTGTYAGHTAWPQALALFALGLALAPSRKRGAAGAGPDVRPAPS